MRLDQQSRHIIRDAVPRHLGERMIDITIRYWHTLRYLRPVQFYGRLCLRLLRPQVSLAPAPGVRLPTGVWHLPAQRRPSLLGRGDFSFLNERGALQEIAWDGPQREKLWRYNQHYFDDLSAAGAQDRCAWHAELLRDWVRANPPAVGTGWEPYPTSLRVVNWIKWALAGNALPSGCVDSLAVQVRWLARRLEVHLLGNHLFANAKALVFAGCFFSGKEAEVWLAKGLRLLAREIPEQILPDGGQFERSPMYHALAFEDMLDLLNLAHAYPQPFGSWSGMLAAWPALIGRMEHWLRAMCHPDGEIAFFNDAATGIAPSPAKLFEYASRLGVLRLAALQEEITRLDPSGYIRIALGPAVLLIDAAPVGPDYLPGHAHADTLSYELSLFGQRVVVNSGTSRYEAGPQREWERGTAAHSTVEIDRQNSSEVWAGFRVARRAYPFDISIKREGAAVIVEAAHDGYRRLRSRPVHRRRWILHSTRLEVLDIVEGAFSEAVSRVYFHPEIHIRKVNAGGTANCLDKKLSWQTSVLESAVEVSSWHPEFGFSVPNSCLRMTIPPSEQTANCRFTLEWI